MFFSNLIHLLGGLAVIAGIVINAVSHNYNAMMWAVIALLWIIASYVRGLE